MSQIVPTVGRIVLCYDPASNIDGLPGIILNVDADGYVNVSVFGTNRTMPGVRVLDPDANIAKGGPYCTWIPYQKGQAARTEAAEALPRELMKSGARVLDDMNDILERWKKFADEMGPMLKASMIEKM